MKVKDVLVFKDNSHVNWNATEQEVRNWVINTYPDSKPSELTMIHSKLMTKLRSLVKDLGVTEAYNQCVGK